VLRSSFTGTKASPLRELIDADLGGGLIKQRIARPGQGKSGGHRTIIAYKEGKRAVLLYGFPKKDKENLEDDELVSCLAIGLK
jgi:hypothetical protein